VYATLLSPIRAICPTHLILLDFFVRITFCEQYKSLSSSLYSFLHFHVYLSLLGPNTLLNTLLTNTLSLRSSFNVSDQFSHPYKTTFKTIFLDILNFTYFGKQTGRQNILHRMIVSIPWLQSALNFFLNRILIR
jgi:hypothetical protein